MSIFSKLNEATSYARTHLDLPLVWVEESEAFFDLELFLSLYKGTPSVLLVASDPCEGDWIIHEDFSLEEKDYSFIDGFISKKIYCLCGKDFLENISEKGILELKDTKKLRGQPIPKKVEGIETRPALFLDRDGVIIHDTGYVHKKEDIRLYEDVIPLIQWANAKNWRVCVLTNQAGIAYGLFDIDAVDAVHHEIETLLKKEGALIDAWYACPFVRSKKSISMFNFDSIRRKPNCGLLLDACNDFPIDLGKSVMVGDKESDTLLVGGLESLLVKRQYDLSNARSAIFNSLQEILDYLKAKKS